MKILKAWFGSFLRRRRNRTLFGRRALPSAHGGTGVAQGARVDEHRTRELWRVACDDVPAALLRLGVEKIWGPGRHKAGNNTFSYFLDPAGNTVEYTTAMETIDEDVWHPSKYDFTYPDVQDQWGTANQMDEFVAKKSFNDPDQGLFVAPPV